MQCMHACRIFHSSQKQIQHTWGMGCGSSFHTHPTTSHPLFMKELIRSLICYVYQCQSEIFSFQTDTAHSLNTDCNFVLIVISWQSCCFAYWLVSCGKTRKTLFWIILLFLHFKILKRICSNCFLFLFLVILRLLLAI